MTIFDFKAHCHYYYYNLNMNSNNKVEDYERRLQQLPKINKELEE